MDGRIISVNAVEDKEGYGHREILIKIPEPPMPNQPMDYVPDWRAIEEQQPRFTEGNIHVFMEYEAEMKKYDIICGVLDAFHIGGVAIAQAEVKE